MKKKSSKQEYLTQLSFKSEGEVKYFADKKILREFIAQSQPYKKTQCNVSVAKALPSMHWYPI